MTQAGDARSRSIGPEDLIAFNDEIAALVRAGIPLELGLDGAAIGGGRARKLQQRLVDRLRSGESLPQALEAEGPAISPVYRTVVEAGLLAGRLPEALESLSDGTRELLEVRRRLRRASIYPAVILAVAYAFFVGFVLWIVPRFIDAYSVFRLPSRISLAVLDGLHETVGTWGPAIPIVVLGCLFVVGPVVRRLSGRGATVDLGGRLLGSWPGTRRLLRTYHNATFAHLLALLLEHEVPLDRAVGLAADGSGDRTLEAESARIAAAVRSGRGLAESLADRVAIPATMRWMIAAGEREGALVPTLKQLEQLYRRRAKSRARWLEVATPLVLTLGLGGGAVLLYALTLFVPLSNALWDLSRPSFGS